MVPSTSAAQVTERVNLGPGYQQAVISEVCGFGRYVSNDGRYVVFQGYPSMAGWNNMPVAAAILRDRLTGTSECVSVDNAGIPRDSAVSLGLSMSGDARFIVFRSEARDLVQGDNNGVQDIFVRDRLMTVTERVSVATDGSSANNYSEFPTVTDDGRFVGFDSLATNLVAGDTNGCTDAFVRDRLLRATDLVSRSSTGTLGNGISGLTTLSGDGRHACFISLATNLVAGDNNNCIDAFVRDRQTGVTRLVSVASDGSQGNGHVGWALVSANGRFVVFTSDASNLVPGDTNGTTDVFVRDLRFSTTECLSKAPAGTTGNGPCRNPSISDDGRFVAFESAATDLLPGTPQAIGGVFVFDRLNDSIEMACTRTDGVLPTSGFSFKPTITADGRFVVFGSDANDLVPNDTNGYRDVFLHDRLATGAANICTPGLNGVLPCPCANPPSGAGRGCDNSSSTGGAYLLASGIAYLSLDTLAFTTHDERPQALSILLQCTGPVPQGAAFGQGVRCAGGSMTRLFVKTANAGSITAPDANSNDPSISARSAALGAPIQATEPHLYLVYYRDPNVHGGCPATSTFNATQTCSIGWWP